jgi:hypothetical protein
MEKPVACIYGHAEGRTRRSEWVRSGNFARRCIRPAGNMASVDGRETADRTAARGTTRGHARFALRLRLGSNLLFVFEVG